MMHDCSLTEDNVVVYDLPVTFDLEAAMSGTSFPTSGIHDYGARIGVMPRAGTDADIRWFEIEPCYVFHPLNAYDDGEIGRARRRPPPPHVRRRPARTERRARPRCGAGRSTWVPAW